MKTGYRVFIGHDIIVKYTEIGKANQLSEMSSLLVKYGSVIVKDAGNGAISPQIFASQDNLFIAHNTVNVNNCIALVSKTRANVFNQAMSSNVGNSANNQSMGRNYAAVEYSEIDPIGPLNAILAKVGIAERIAAPVTEVQAHNQSAALAASSSSTGLHQRAGAESTSAMATVVEADAPHKARINCCDKFTNFFKTMFGRTANIQADRSR